MDEHRAPQGGARCAFLPPFQPAGPDPGQLGPASQFIRHHHAGTVTYAALLGSLVLAAVFGVLRAMTVRIWLTDGQPWSRGSWVTASLWIVALAAHLGYDALVAGHGTDNVGDATIVLYLAVSLDPAPGRAPAGPAPGRRPGARFGPGCSYGMTWILRPIPRLKRSSAPA